MKRLAVIIGCALPRHHSEHLRGVSEDVMNHKSFLTSANGGAWAENEVIELIDPSFREIQRAKNFQSNCDVAVTHFFGHGYSEDADDFLFLNENDSFNYLELFPMAKRSLVLMDACRKDNQNPPAEGIFGLGLEFEQENRQYARKIYESALSHTPEGRVAIFSTSKGATAMDTDDGGAFTIEFFSQLVNWVNTSREFYLPVKTIFDKTKVGLLGYPYPQEPEISATSLDMLIFPIATNPKILSGQKPIGKVNDTLSKNQLSRKRGSDIYIIG